LPTHIERFTVNSSKSGRIVGCWISLTRRRKRWTR
jgi:hypothetical protein